MKMKFRFFRKPFRKYSTVSSSSKDVDGPMEFSRVETEVTLPGTPEGFSSICMDNSVSTPEVADITCVLDFNNSVETSNELPETNSPAGSFRDPNKQNAGDEVKIDEKEKDERKQEPEQKQEHKQEPEQKQEHKQEPEPAVDIRHPIEHIVFQGATSSDISLPSENTGATDKVILKIEGDDSPEFRDFKRESSLQTENLSMERWAFGAGQLPKTVHAPPQIVTKRKVATPPRPHSAPRRRDSLGRSEALADQPVPLKFFADATTGPPTRPRSNSRSRTASETGKTLPPRNLTDDSRSVSSNRSAATDSDVFKRCPPARTCSFKARPLPKSTFTGPSIPVRHQMGPHRKEVNLSARWESAPSKKQ